MQKTAAEGSWGTFISHKTGKRATLVGYDSYYLSTHTKKRSPRSDPLFRSPLSSDHHWYETRRRFAHTPRVHR